MRHFLSLALGTIFAPVIWVLTAWSTYRFGSLTQSAEALSEIDKPGAKLVIPLLLLAIAGAFVGILLSSQLSPIGPGISGILLMITAGVFLFQPQTMLSVLRLVPGEHDVVLAVPVVAGSAFLLGTALVVPLVSPARWRRQPEPTAASTATSVELPRQRGSRAHPEIPTQPVPARRQLEMARSDLRRVPPQQGRPRRLDSTSEYFIQPEPQARHGRHAEPSRHAPQPSDWASQTAIQRYSALQPEALEQEHVRSETGS